MEAVLRERNESRVEGRVETDLHLAAAELQIFILLSANESTVLDSWTALPKATNYQF